MGEIAAIWAANSTSGGVAADSADAADTSRDLFNGGHEFLNDLELAHDLRIGRLGRKTGLLEFSSVITKSGEFESLCGGLNFPALFNSSKSLSKSTESPTHGRIGPAGWKNLKNKYIKYTIESFEYVNFIINGT